MDEALYTVKEYARRAGVTEQAIYKRIKRENSDLKPYVVELHGRKYIKPEAVELIDDTPTIEQVETEALREMVEMLKEQIAAKDEQISYLQVMNRQLAETNKQLSTALEDTTESLKAAQALHAGTLQQQMQEQDSQDATDSNNDQKEQETDNEINHDRPGDNDAQGDEQKEQHEPETTAQQEEPKKGFFARLFGW